MHDGGTSGITGMGVLGTIIKIVRMSFVATTPLPQRTKTALAIREGILAQSSSECYVHVINRPMT
jgi:hypothetical protein